MPAGEARGGAGANAGTGSRGRAASGAAGVPGREQGPNMSLDYAFKTELFWIACRANNCRQYCLGHQESKLLIAGLKEDEIAALYGDWSEFTPAQRSAFRLENGVRKRGQEPYLKMGSENGVRNRS
jgi:hypothetical protein